MGVLCVGSTFACGGGNATVIGPTESHFSLADFSLAGLGIEFELHPNGRPILVSASGGARLQVCEVGSSFANFWHGGCRRLTGRPLALPATNGLMHVAFRVVGTPGAATRVKELRLRWHCVDHDFGFFPGRTKASRTQPVFDC
jgi:hypothetical protein